ILLIGWRLSLRALPICFVRRSFHGLHAAHHGTPRPTGRAGAGGGPGGLCAHAAFWRRPAGPGPAACPRIAGLHPAGRAPAGGRRPGPHGRWPLCRDERNGGGFYLLDCATREEAVAIARECPAAEWATVGVREEAPCYHGIFWIGRITNF